MTEKIRTGTAGWSYKDWEGKFYPPGMPAKADRLKYFADYFDLTSFLNHAGTCNPPGNFFRTSPAISAA